MAALHSEEGRSVSHRTGSAGGAVLSDEDEVGFHGLDQAEVEQHDDTPTSVERRGTRVRIDYDICESTGCCAAVCPENVLAHEKGKTRVINAVACTSCWICVDNCVSGAIEID